MPKAERFRLGVGAVIRRSDGQVLALERRDIPGAWQFVQGGVHEGEDLREALFREVQEETGLERSDFAAVREIPVLLGYELPESARRHKTGRGQVHKWFILEVARDVPEVGFDAGGEFISFQWMQMSAVIDVVVDFRHAVYEELAKWLSASPLAHFTLATRDVEATARFIDSTLGFPRKALPANAIGPVVWFDIGGGQEMHILHVDGFEISPHEAEFGRHVAVFHPLADFVELKARLIAEGAVLIDPVRPTPFERFFFREPVNGYVFEVIDQARASHFDQ